MSCLAVGLALSLHFGLEKDYNQIHPYVKCETERTVTGLYYNSLDKLSAFGAVSFPLVNKYTEEELSIDVGLVQMVVSISGLATYAISQDATLSWQVIN